MLAAMVAALHYLGIMGLAASLSVEVLTLKGEITAAAVRRLARTDLIYGLTAALILVTGIARVVWFGKGVDFYLDNWIFHLKVTIFIVVGLWSILPTVRFIQWRTALETTGALPTAEQFNAMRKVVFSELHLLALLPILAAMMARGYGVFGG